MRSAQIPGHRLELVRDHVIDLCRHIRWTQNQVTRDRIIALISGDIWR